MKKTILILSVFALIASTCKQETENLITMTTQANKITLTLAGTGKVSIDWGSRSFDIHEHELSDYPTVYEIEYPDRDVVHKIRVTGDVTFMNCNWNQLKKLNLKRNAGLKVLECGYNPLKKLNLKRNTQLEVLDCSGNQLKKLDVTQNPLLGNLICGQNQLEKLDLSQNTQLYRLYCVENNLKNLDLSQNKKLTDLVCGQNQLEKLDVGKNL